MTGTSIATINAYINIASPVHETLVDNVISKLFIGGTSTGIQIIRGIYNNTNNGGTHFRIVARNTIDSLYTSAAMTANIVGIWSQVGFDVAMYKNKITRLWPGQSATAGSFAQGIRIHSGTTVKAYNNIIALDLTQGPNNNVMNNANSVSGIEVVGMAAAGSVSNLYYNSIRIAGAGVTAFGTSGINISSSVNANGTVTMRDNLVSNFATPGPTGGITAALRKANTSATYGTTSNNNLWYTTQTASTPIYYVTAPTATLVAFKALVTPRETVSIGDLPIFVNAAQNDLHLDPSNNCNIDGAGAPIATYTDDYDTDPRDAVTPDIGMDEFSGTGTGFTWKGYNTDWMNAANWCGGVPTTTSDVVIPAGKTYYPIITNTLPVARNININLGASITINATGTLSNTGSWTNDGTLTNNGTIVLNGTVNQSFPGAGTTGTIPVMTNLTASNTGGVTINKPLTMIGNLNPKVGNLSVNDVVTLHSDASGTAFVDTVLGTISYSGPGKFVVERFITTNNITGPYYGVGWRYLAAPITGTQTISQAWQEGEVAPTYTANGYGTQIVGPGGPAVGYDVANTLPSLKKYDPTTNTYVAVPGTNGTNFISATDGYMLFIRGDRGANAFGLHNPTTLRMSGPIKTGNVTLSTPTANNFIPVGNPYPCAINFTSMAKTNLQDYYYIWDPKIGQYGAWQTFTGPSYNPSTLGASYVNGQSNIESGMAFMVRANAIAGTHSVQITENCKRTTSFSVARVNGDEKQLRTRLIGGVGSPVVFDGNRVDFDPAYSNTVDDNDAEKMVNFGENFGIVRDGLGIVVERRAEIVDTDTIFFKMDKMKVQDYQLEFTAENLASPVLTAYLEDAFLNSRTQINLDAVTTVPFSVTADPLSKAADRFRIVFKQQGIVPLSFIRVKAFRQDRNIMVDWTVANEANIAQYEIQHSADGRNFSQLGTQAARNINGVGSQEYNLLDVQPYSGDNFYRIKSVNNSGEIKYSQIVNVNMKGDPSSIAVYPNPVKEDGIVSVSMMNQPKAVYKVNLINVLGQVIFTRTINHDGGNSVYSFELNGSLAHGTYQLQVAEGNKVKTTIKILY
ncbi:MAG: T9SS type A sorting domain-containing protein [Ferruginibacter sp.]